MALKQCPQKNRKHWKRIAHAVTALPLFSGPPDHVSPPAAALTAGELLDELERRGAGPFGDEDPDTRWTIA